MLVLVIVSNKLKVPRAVLHVQEKEDKKMKKTINGNKKLLMVWIMSFAMPCAMLSGIIPAVKVSAAVKPSVFKSMTITEGEKEQIMVAGTFVRSSTFKSTKTRIATVSKKGVVKAKKAGKCKIIITVKYYKSKNASRTSTTTLTCKVTVKKNMPKNKKDIAALKALIAKQRKRGATISKDLNSRQYFWENGRLISIGWSECNLSGDLDMSELKALITMDCSNNHLNRLDISKNKTFRSLDCINNNLNSLNVSKNAKLESLFCGKNNLDSLDVSKNAKLKSLDCNDNQLSRLNINRNVALDSLDCSGNQLKRLDISKNINLKRLDCGNNQLSNLDVSKNKALWDFNCDHNQLNSLDVSKNAKLKCLNCKYNNLRNLDVSKNVKLMYLNCFGNQLSSLDLTKNTKLAILSCDDTLSITGYDGYIIYEDTTIS